MKMLGRLPRRQQEPARTVFRCYQCDHVIQDENGDQPSS